MCICGLGFESVLFLVVFVGVVFAIFVPLPLRAWQFTIVCATPPLSQPTCISWTLMMIGDLF